MPSKAMAAYVTARAEYDKTTKVLRFVMDDQTPADDGNTIVVYLLDPKTNKKWFNGTDNCFNWTAEIKGATHVNIEDNFEYMLPSCKQMFSGFSSLTTINGGVYLNTHNVTSMEEMFSGCKLLTSVVVRNFNTDNVTDMYRMFYDCNALERPDVSNFKTDKVTYMAEMFSGCNSLKELNVSNFETDEVTHMYSMFEGCSSLTTLDVSNFKTDKAESMHTMFSGCTNLKKLDLSKFKTANVTNMDEMFKGCSSLEKLDVSNFNTAKVTSMVSMFEGCSSLEKLDVSNFNTAIVGDMRYIFEGCKSLTELDISNFNTAKITDVDCMFYDCNNLEHLDLSSFNTAKVTDMRNMFYNCGKLAKIYVSDQFTTDAVNMSYDMFYNCSSLPNFKNANLDKTNAHYGDGGYLLTYYRTADGELNELSGDEPKVDKLDLDDSKYFVAHAPFTATTATYSRTLNGGTTWATLCLPFDVNLEGQNFHAYKVVSVGDDNVELEELTASIAAGTPVIIKMNEGATDISISEGDRLIATAPKADAQTDAQYQLTGLYTPRTFSKDTDNNCYIVKGDKLMNPSKILEGTTTSAVGSKAFRAYLKENATTAAPARMLSLGGQTTSIDKIADTLNGGDGTQYFDLQGHRLDAPQKGMNIVRRGGKTTKIMIR